MSETPTFDAQYWDDLYRSREQLFSGNPNGALVDEIAEMPPGRALDLGCGEGADAHWLSRRGWQVTAVDIAEVALQRAAATGDGTITWQRADLTTTAPPAACFDLVSAHYFPLPRDRAALHGLLAAVAPGGTLLVVAHDPADLPADHGVDLRAFYQPTEIADALDDSWTVEVHERRERTAPAPEGPPHVHDLVLRARKHEC